MSIKSIVLFTSLFMILASQSSIVHAAIDDEVDATESTKSSLRPLLDLDSVQNPLSEFELKSSLPESPLKSYTLMTQEALDKEMIPGLKGASVLSTGLEDEILQSQLAKRIQFSPNDIKKHESWLQIIEEKLQKWAPYFPSAYYGNYGYGMLD